MDQIEKRLQDRHDRAGILALFYQNISVLAGMPPEHTELTPFLVEAAIPFLRIVDHSANSIRQDRRVSQATAIDCIYNQRWKHAMDGGLYHGERGILKAAIEVAMTEVVIDGSTGEVQFLNNAPSWTKGLEPMQIAEAAAAALIGVRIAARAKVGKR